MNIRASLFAGLLVAAIAVCIQTDQYPSTMPALEPASAAVAKTDIWPENFNTNGRLPIQIWAPIRSAVSRFLEGDDRLIDYEILDAKSDGPENGPYRYTVRVALLQRHFDFVGRQTLDIELSWQDDGLRVTGSSKIGDPTGLADDELHGLVFGDGTPGHAITDVYQWALIRSAAARFLDAYDLRLYDLGLPLATPDFDSNYVGPEVVIPIGGVYPAFIDYSFQSAESLGDGQYRVRVKVHFIDYYSENNPQAISSMIMSLDMIPRGDSENHNYGVSRAWKSDVVELHRYEPFPGLVFEDRL